MPPSRNTNRQSLGAPAYYPEDHRDDYSSDPYQPHPQDNSYPLTAYQTQYDDDDRQPILDPHSQLNTPLTGAVDSAYFPQSTPSPSPSTPGLRRWKTVKKVELFNGNLVLDCPVPKKLLGMLPQKKEREFTHMR